VALQWGHINIADINAHAWCGGEEKKHIKPYQAAPGVYLTLLFEENCEQKPFNTQQQLGRKSHSNSNQQPPWREENFLSYHL
jgi:hypothetical protein